MILTFPQIVALVFGLIVIAKTLTDFRNKQENWLMFLFWLILWLGIIFIAFYPMIISRTISRLGDSRLTVSQVIGAGFVFILFVVYRVYIKANRLEKQMNQIVRKIALKDVKKGKKN